MLAALSLALTLTAASVSRPGAQAPQGVETFDAAWRIIRDSHFDTTLNGLDWDAVSRELRPKAEAARTPGELRAVIRDMLGGSASRILRSCPEAPTAPRTCRRISAARPASTSGCSTAISSSRKWTRMEPLQRRAFAPVGKCRRSMAAPSQRCWPTCPESLAPRLRNVEAWRLAHTRLHGPSGSRAAVTFEDGSGAATRLEIERRVEGGQPVTVGNLPTMFVRVRSERATTPAGRTAGVIAFNVWMTAVDPLFQQAVDEFRSSDGIVIDLRGNPGGLAAMLMGISGHFIDERKALGVMKTRDNPLRFVVNPRRVNARGERVQPFAGPVAILVDALSGSASECFAGGMQSLGRVRVFGQQTHGPGAAGAVLAAAERGRVDSCVRRFRHRRRNAARGTGRGSGPGRAARPGRSCSAATTGHWRRRSPGSTP